MMCAKKKLATFAANNPLLIRLYKNVGILFGGNASSALLGMVALAILTRALGVQTFGIYALLTAYISLIDRLVTFQTWQALIHYGAKALREGAHERLSSLLFFGWILDAGSGAVGALFAVSGAIFFPALFGIENVSWPVVTLAAGALLFNWAATPMTVLRLFDRFSHQAIYLNVNALIKIVGYFALWMGGVTALEPYVALWALGTVAGRLYLFVFGWKLARSKGLLRRVHLNFTRMFQEAPGLWRFVVTTNLDGIVRILRELDIFVVNAILGPSGAGLYKIARDVAKIPTQLTGPFYQAIYPDLSRLVAERRFKEFTKLMRQSSVTLGAIVALIWGVFGILGQWAIGFVFGAAYVPAYGAAVWCVGAVAIWALAQPLSPAMLALGKAGTNLMVHLVTGSLYIAMVGVFTKAFGLTGAGGALFCFYALWALSMGACFRNALKKEKI